MRINALFAVAALLAGGALGWVLRGLGAADSAPSSNTAAHDTKISTRSPREISNPG